MKELTDKQKRFIDEYPKDFNATQTAIRAGYSPNSAAVMACRLLKNPQVSQEIEKRMGEIEEKTDVEVGEIIAALREMAFGGKPATNSERLKALDLLGRYKAMYTDRVVGDDPKTIEIEENKKALYRELAQAHMRRKYLPASQHDRPDTGQEEQPDAGAA